MADRITLGRVLGALIVGAAMLMRLETAFRLFGYPGFAILLFLLAARHQATFLGPFLAS